MAHGEMNSEEFATFNQKWMGVAASVLMDGGLLASFIDWRSVEIILAVGRGLDLDLLNIVVWQKTNGGQGSLWRSQHELLPVLKKGKAPHTNNVQLGRYGRYRTNVWTYPGGSSLGSEVRAESDSHPTIKPRVMLEDALLDVTNRGEIVLDPFLGSGSTMLAAETTGRLCRAIEIDGRYCDVAIQRWQSLTGGHAVLAETGEAFAEVSQRRNQDLHRQEDIDAK
jgi:DNA modification methylase